MKNQFSVRSFRTTLLVGSIVAAFIATPMLYAAGEPTEQPAGSAPKEQQQPVAPPTSQPQPSTKSEKVSLEVTGMKSAQDPEKIRKELRQTPGVVSVACQQTAGTCDVEINPAQLKKEEVPRMINKLGYHARLKTAGEPTVKGTPQ